MKRYYKYYILTNYNIYLLWKAKMTILFKNSQDLLDVLLLRVHNCRLEILIHY